MKDDYKSFSESSVSNMLLLLVSILIGIPIGFGGYVFLSLKDWFEKKLNRELFACFLCGAVIAYIIVKAFVHLVQ